MDRKAARTLRVSGFEKVSNASRLNCEGSPSRTCGGHCRRKGGALYLDLLFMTCVVVIYLEPFLTRKAGKTIANLIVSASIWGMLSLLTMWCVEAF